MSDLAEGRETSTLMPQMSWGLELFHTRSTKELTEDRLSGVAETTIDGHSMSNHYLRDAGLFKFGDAKQHHRRPSAPPMQDWHARRCQRRVRTGWLS